MRPGKQDGGKGEGNPSAAAVDVSQALVGSADERLELPHPILRDMLRGRLLECPARMLTPLLRKLEGPMLGWESDVVHAETLRQF